MHSFRSRWRAFIWPGMALLLVVASILVIMGLASGSILGGPETVQKSVTLTYTPQAKGSPLMVLLEPPMSVLNVDEAPQPLALQFTNTGGSKLILGPPSIEPDCFQFTPTDADPSHVITLDPHQSRVVIYHLSARTQVSGRQLLAPKDCQGRRSLAFYFQFGEVCANPKKTSDTPLHGQQAIATSPILITDQRHLVAQRRLHIASLFAIPLILAFATFLLQQFQELRAEQQKLGEQKLEVWKVIFPMIDKYMRELYTPINRAMAIARDETAKDPAKTTPDLDNIIASIVILRALFNHLGSKTGGYYFRYRGGEDLVQILTANFWERCYEFMTNKDELATCVDAIHRTDSISIVKGKLLTLCTANAAVDTFTKDLRAALTPTHIAQLDRYLSLTIQVLDFENTVLWYPEWYTKPSPIDMANLVPHKLHLPASASPTNWEQQWRDTLLAYQKELPKNCVLHRIK